MGRVGRRSVPATAMQDLALYSTESLALACTHVMASGNLHPGSTQRTHPGRRLRYDGTGDVQAAETHSFGESAPSVRPGGGTAQCRPENIPPPTKAVRHTEVPHGEGPALTSKRRTRGL
jgi:hypothetical protein